MDAVEIIPRRVAEAALSLNAAGVILAHNHVSGLGLSLGGGPGRPLPTSARSWPASGWSCWTT